MVEPIMKGTKTKVIAITLVLIATALGGGLYVNSQLRQPTPIQTTDNSNKLQSLINAYPWIGVGLSHLNQTTEAIPIIVTGMYGGEGIGSLSLQAGDGLNAMTEIVQDEVNAYCQKIGSNYRFDFVPFPILNTPQGVEDSNQAFTELGVKMVIQDEWSISYNSTLSSIRNNGMLYLIGRDTSWITDTLNGVYGIRPEIDRGDYYYAVTSAQGVKALVVLERDWSPLQPYQAASMKQHTDKMLQDYEALGGKVFQRILYTGAEEVDPYNMTHNADFSSYLTKAEAAVKDATATYGEGKVGILVTCGEISPMIYQSRDMAGLMNVPWFGTELSSGVGVRAGIQGSHQVDPYAEKVGFYLPVESVENKAALEKLKGELASKTGLKKYWYGVQETMRYDGCWLLALSVIKANSTDPKKVEAVLPQVAAEYNGINGNYAMDEKGDKISYIVDIYKVYQTDTGNYAHFMCGEYNPLSGVVFKDTTQPLP